VKCPVLLFVDGSPPSLWELCETPAGVLQGHVEKPFFVFPHVRQFPSGCPFLSFLVLFSFFRLPVPDGIGLYNLASIGAAFRFVFTSEL
jgi:hypothetical protein